MKIKSNIYKILLISGLLIFLNLNSSAQFPAGYGWVFPRESPPANVSQIVGVTEISIKYSRPSVKKRVIWGCKTEDVIPSFRGGYDCLVPNGQVWRAGANEATNITFSTNVSVEGQPLSAGTYGLFMIPGDAEWTIIFNKRANQWGSFTYKESDDALRVKVKPQTTAETQEQLSYDFPTVSNNNAQIALNWEKMRIVFNVETDSAKQASLMAKKSFDPASGYFAANYYYQNKTNLEEALSWINAAIAFSESGGNLLLKAKILAELKRYKEAVETGKKALAFFESKKSEKSAEEMRELIGKWEKESN